MKKNILLITLCLFGLILGMNLGFSSGGGDSTYNDTAISAEEETQKTEETEEETKNKKDELEEKDSTEKPIETK